MKLFARESKHGMALKLRTKFLIGIILVECLIMSGTILLVERQMRDSILDEFVKLGVAISKNLSAVNANYVTTYNYVGIEQNVTKAVNENDLAYAMIQFFDGEIAAYSGEKAIREAVIQNAVDTSDFAAAGAVVRYLRFGPASQRICDLASPIVIGDKQWATVRVGLSLEAIQNSIGNTRWALFLLGLVALAIGGVGAVFFSSRITRPVASLVTEVEAISQGDYDKEIRINSRDEIGYLARRFRAMKESLKENIRLLKNSNDELSNTNQRLQSLFEASQSMNSFKNQDRLYDLILEMALTATEAFGASLVLMQPDSVPQVAARIADEEKANGRHADCQRLLEDLPFLQPQGTIDPELGPCAFNLEFIDNTPFFKTQLGSFPDMEILSLPLGSPQDITGYINLIRYKKHTVDTPEMQTLIVLASQITTSIENNHLFNQLEQAYLSSIKSLAKTLEFKDEYTHGHAERVAGVCQRIAEKMGLDAATQKVLYNAALLHDIGKIGVLESILNKKSALDDEEYRMIKKHSRYGEEILRPIFSLKEERKIVRHHHEREDGRGYPDGLDGSELSLPEKIIIVADAFDAMSSKRSYRDALGREAIIHELQVNSGTQFDGDVVQVLLDLYNQETEEPNDGKHIITFPAISFAR